MAGLIRRRGEHPEGDGDPAANRPGPDTSGPTTPPGPRAAARPRRRRAAVLAALVAACAALVSACGSTAPSHAAARPADNNASVVPATPHPSCAQIAVRSSGDPCPRTYVALGDSYSSGESDGPYLPGTDSIVDRCHRSASAYPEAVEKDLADTYPNLVFRACSGADTGNFAGTSRYGEPPQDHWLDNDTGLVTLTVGGNDIGFADAMAYCALRVPIAPSCQQRSSSSVNTALANLQPTVAQLLRQVKQQAPRAQVWLVGYPRLFPGAPPSSCPTGVPGMSFNSSDMRWINEETEHLDSVLRRAADSAGVSYADTWDALAGHELCTPEPWINAAVVSINPDRVSGSYHPTPSGQRAMANAFLAAYRDGPGPYVPTA